MVKKYAQNKCKKLTKKRAKRVNRTRAKRVNRTRAEQTRAKRVNRTRATRARQYKGGVNGNEDTFKGLMLKRKAIYTPALRDLDLKAIVLPGITLSSKVLNNLDFTDANLEGARFKSARLQKTKFEGANLINTTFNNAELQDTFFNNANLHRADLTNADLTNANLTGAILTDAILKDAILTGAILTDAILTGTILDLAGPVPPISVPKITQPRPRKTNAQKVYQNEELMEMSNSEIQALTIQNYNFSGVDLTNKQMINIELTDTNFIGANLTNVNFTGANLTMVNFTNANLTNANLTNATLFQAIFTGADLTGATIKGFIALPNLVGAKSLIGLKTYRHTGPGEHSKDTKQIFISNLDLTGLQSFNDKITDRSEYTKITFTDAVFTSLKVSDSKFTEITCVNTTFDNIQCSKVIFERSTFTNSVFKAFIKNRNLQFITNIFKNTSFIGAKMIETILSKNTFTRCNFQDCDLDRSYFSDNVFTECTMIRTNMCNYQMMKGSILPTRFISCNLTSAVFNGANLADTDFTNSTLNECQFIPTIEFVGQPAHMHRPTEFSSRTIFTNAQLQNTTFQSCVGLAGYDFSNLNFTGANFSTGTNLAGCLFRNSTLINTNFDGAIITNCDFTNSRRDPMTNFVGAIGLETAIGLSPIEMGEELTPENIIGDDGLYDPNVPVKPKYPDDIHKAFSFTDINQFVTVISEYITVEPDKIPKTNIDVGKMVNDFCRKIIDGMNAADTPESEKFDKDILRQHLKNIWEQSLSKCVDFTVHFAPKTDPPILWSTLLYYVIEYVKTQNKQFQEFFVNAVIAESGSTYGAQGISCQRGINERFIIKLLPTMISVQDTIDDRKKLLEFYRVRNAVDPSVKLPTVIEFIPEDREGLRQYIAAQIDNTSMVEYDVTDEIRDRWFNSHKEGGPSPFIKSGEPPKFDKKEIMVDYLKYLFGHFKYDELTPFVQKILIGQLKEQIKIMNIVLFEADGMDYQFSGGGRNRRIINIFTLTGKQFTQLWHKVNGNGKKH